jgi:carboxypeptidase C (cathepsin A)
MITNFSSVLSDNGDWIDEDMWYLYQEEKSTILIWQ